MLQEGEREQLLAELQADVTTVGTATGRESSTRTWIKFHTRWFGPSSNWLPITCDSLRAIAAQMKHAGYRSFSNYVVAVKEAHEDALHEWTRELERCRRKCIASTQRGIGPAKQCLEMDPLKVAALGLGCEPLNTQGPICPGHWAVLCSYHILRGAESASALASSLTVNSELLVETWALPASKTDTQAVGCKRSWGCICADPDAYDGTSACPYHAASWLLVDLHRRFANEDGCLPVDLPLFPTAAGDWCSRDGFIDTLTQMTTTLGIDPVDSMGRNAIGEHIWRVSGSRLLARAGIPQLSIMLLARWGSNIILRYIADAPLATLTATYRQNTLTGASEGYVPPTGIDTHHELAALQPITNDDCEASKPDNMDTIVSGIDDVGPTARFALNTQTDYLHVIANRRAWERARKGRTVCGWDYVGLCAPTMNSAPSNFMRCGKCAKPTAWQVLLSEDEHSE